MNEPFIFGRITRSWLWCVENKVFDQWPHSTLIVYEHSLETGTSKDKTHIHFVITNALNRGTLFERKWWQQLNLKGNADFSFKKKYNPTDPPFVYMAKGKLEPVYNTMRNQEELRIDRELWKEPVSTTVVNEITIIKKETSKVTNFTIAQELIGEWREWYLSNHTVDEMVDRDRIVWILDDSGRRMLIRLAAQIMKKYKKGRYYRNVAQICQEAICEIDPAGWHDKVFSML